MLVVAGVTWDGPVDFRKYAILQAGFGPYALAFSVLAQLEGMALCRHYLAHLAVSLGRPNLVLVERVDWWRTGGPESANTARQLAEYWFYATHGIVLLAGICYIVLYGLSYVERAVIGADPQGMTWSGLLLYFLMLLTLLAVPWLAFCLVVAGIVLYFSYVRELIVLIRHIRQQQAPDSGRRQSR